MALGGGQVALWQPLGTARSSTVTSGAQLTAISGLTGWWDAGVASGLAGPSGTAVAGWNQAVGGVVDRSSGGHVMTPYSFATPSGLPNGTPRLAGTLGGLGRLAANPNPVTPGLDPDLGFQVSGNVLGWTSAWTWLLVWSRPNWRQGSGRDGNPATLLTAGTTPLLQADSLGGGQSLGALSRDKPDGFGPDVGAPAYSFDYSAIPAGKRSQCLARWHSGRLERRGADDPFVQCPYSLSS